jgi:hypothetical protein
VAFGVSGNVLGTAINFTNGSSDNVEVGGNTFQYATNAFSGTTGQVMQNLLPSSGTWNIRSGTSAFYQPPVGIGAQTVNSLETISGTDGAVFLGTQSFMLLSAQWRG